MSIRDSYYSDNDKFGSADGLNFAFAITDYDDNRNSVEDPRIGQVRAKIVSWGLNHGKITAVDVDGGRLEDHICT